MKSFLKGIRIAEQHLSDFLAACGIAVSAREAVFALTIALTFICAIATIVSIGTITEQHILLGEKYGKYNSRKAGIKRIFLVIAIVFAALTFLVFLIDGFANFTNIAMLFSYIRTVFLCVGIEIVALGIGAFIRGRNVAKRDKKYEKEINAILSKNPVYVEALTRIKNNNKIKMIAFFRDGIAFYNSVNFPDDNRKKETSYWDEEFPEKEKNKALATKGSVVSTLSNSKIKFSDYGYQNSASAMYDLYKYIFEATSPRFKQLAYTKEWIYRKTGASSGPTGAIINGNTVTFTGYSSDPDKIKSTGAVILSYILYDDTPSNCKEELLKKW